MTTEPAAMPGERERTTVSPAERTSRSTLMVGLPRTGKTSYLGLLFVGMVRAADGELRLDAFDQEHSYLNKVAEQLLRFTPADHTQIDHEEGLDLTVRLPNRQTLTLYVPDLSGETWQAAHVERVIDSALIQRFRDVEGYMLFTNVGEFLASTTIAEGKAAALDVGATEQEWYDGADPREQGDSPTQVALVDLVQVMQERHEGPFRLSLILSAFDVARESDKSISPRSWVASNMPLLDQFLGTQSDTVRCHIYGVSAQGGVYAPTGVETDLAGVAPLDKDLLERAYVVDEDGNQINIYQPLLWALGDV